MTQSIFSFFMNLYTYCFPVPALVAEESPLRIKIPRITTCDSCPDFAVLHQGSSTPKAWSCRACVTGSCPKKRPDLVRPSSQTF